MRKRIAVVFCALLAAAPIWASQNFAVTPSGSTEMLFAEKAAAALSQLSGKCIDARWTVISTTANELVCEAPLTTGQSIMGQMLLGNSYSTPPRRFFKFNAVETSGVSRVQASGWMETQMPFGQMQRADFSGADFHNSIMGFMGSAGGKPPVGTTFPNHVVMGFNADRVPIGKHFGLRVGEVVPGTPADRAGIRVGDVVFRIAGRKFKDDEEYFDALAKAAKTATYPVALTRDGKELDITLDRDFRPAVTEPVVAKVEPAATAVATPTLHVADEIAKLSQLKEDGVLTQAEFEAQKKKLLGP